MCSCCVHTICFVYLHVSCQPQVGACVPATMSAQKIRPCNPEWNCCLLSREFHAWAKTPLIRRRGYEFPRLKHAIMRKHASGRGHAGGAIRVNLPCNLTAAVFRNTFSNHAIPFWKIYETTIFFNSYHANIQG